MPPDTDVFFRELLATMIIKCLKYVTTIMVHPVFFLSSNDLFPKECDIASNFLLTFQKHLLSCSFRTKMPLHPERVLPCINYTVNNVPHQTV